MLFKPLLGTDLSGKVGGIVASHNAGGAYFRAATVPTNPNTTFQQEVRNAVSSLSVLWQVSLTQAQRDAWDVYAANVKITNRIGEKINVSGLNHYVRSNVPRLQAQVARVDDGPTVFTFAAYTAPSMTAWSEATQAGDIAFTTDILTDPWANALGGFMFVYVSRPQNSGIQFFRGPYRRVGTVTGDPVPPASPSNFGSAFPFVAGQRLFGRAIVTRPDGAISSPSFFTVLAVA